MERQSTRTIFLDEKEMIYCENNFLLKALQGLLFQMPQNDLKSKNICSDIHWHVTGIKLTRSCSGWSKNAKA